MRKRLWQLHSWLGLLSALGLLLIGLSGACLVFRTELDALLRPEHTRVSPTPAGRLPLDVLRHQIETQLPEYALTGWNLLHDSPERADELYLIRHGSQEWLTATLDPYTGHLLSSPALPESTVTGWLLHFHSTFAAGLTGTALAGLLGLAWLLLGLTGLYLHRDLWRHPLRLRLRSGSRLLLSDLHRLIGSLALLMNLILGLTGAWWNLSEITEAWHRPAPPQEVFHQPLYPDSLSLDRLCSDASTRLPGFQTHFISLPSSPSAPAITLWGAVHPLPFWRNPYGSTLGYGTDGSSRSVHDIRHASLGEQLLASFKPLHFGSFGGWPVKLLYTFAGLSPALLGLSGFLILRRRLQTRA